MEVLSMETEKKDVKVEAKAAPAVAAAPACSC